jgi:hypothetical protein
VYDPTHSLHKSGEKTNSATNLENQREISLLVAILNKYLNEWKWCCNNSAFPPAICSSSHEACAIRSE